MAGRRVALSSLAGGRVEEVPGHDAPTPVRLTPEQIAPTPLNKRTNFGTPDELAELGESIRRRQLSHVVVVTRARYLALYPEHEVRIGAAAYVLVNGERRWRAARQIQLPRLDAMIREDLADSRTDLLEAVIAENIDRLNLDPIEEAHSVEELVTECGSAATAARQLHRTEGWVSQRRSLLRLTPEIQARVQAGEVPVRIARSIASVPPGDQEAALKNAAERKSADRASRRREPRRKDPDTPATGPGPGPGPESGSGPEPGPGAAGQAGSPQPSDGAAAADGSAGRADSGPGGGPGLPWDSPALLAEMIRSRLTDEALAELLRLLAA
jgi:ParB family chromosome partitioning protein